jgi:hypothetical protein
MGIGPIPIDAFARRQPPRYFGDWVDTAESQHLFQYQQRGLDAQLEDMRSDFGVKRHLVRLVRPLATWFATRSSAYFEENRRRASKPAARYAATIGSSSSGVAPCMITASAP